MDFADIFKVLSVAIHTTELQSPQRYLEGVRGTLTAGRLSPARVETV